MSDDPKPLTRAAILAELRDNPDSAAQFILLHAHYADQDATAAGALRYLLRELVRTWQIARRHQAASLLASLDMGRRHELLQRMTALESAATVTDTVLQVFMDAALAAEKRQEPEAPAAPHATPVHGTVRDPGEGDGSTD